MSSDLPRTAPGHTGYVLVRAHLPAGSSRASALSRYLVGRGPGWTPARVDVDHHRLIVTPRRTSRVRVRLGLALDDVVAHETTSRWLADVTTLRTHGGDVEIVSTSAWRRVLAGRVSSAARRRTQVTVAGRASSTAAA